MGEIDQFRGALAADGITVSTDDINEWLNYDDAPPTADSLIDQDIVASVTAAAAESDNNDNDDGQRDDADSSSVRVPTAA